MQITLEFKPEFKNGQLVFKTKEYTPQKRTPLRFERNVDDGYGDFETVQDAQKLLEEEAKDEVSNEKSGRSQESLRGESSPGNGLNAVLLVSGENDDLSGDFMAAVIVDGIVEFRLVIC